MAVVDNKAAAISAADAKVTLVIRLSPQGDRSRESSTPDCEVRPAMQNIPSRAFNEARAVPFSPTRPLADRLTEDPGIGEKVSQLCGRHRAAMS
jgi:hypothetical protein